MTDNNVRHDVIQDTAGWGCYPRLTCLSEGCNGATIIRQPYMDQERWRQELSEFLTDHPCYLADELIG